MRRGMVVVLAMVGAVVVLFTGVLGGTAVGADKRGKIKGQRPPDRSQRNRPRGDHPGRPVARHPGTAGAAGGLRLPLTPR